MTEFEVGGEGQGCDVGQDILRQTARIRFLTLIHSDVSPSLEQHHSNRAPRKAITDDKFSNDIQADLLIRDGLNHSDRNDIEEGYQ